MVISEVAGDADGVVGCPEGIEAKVFAVAELSYFSFVRCKG